MAKSKKPIIALILTFLCLFSSLPAYADEVNIPSPFYTFGIWNKYEVTFTDSANQDSSVSLINSANAEYTPTNMLLGFDVPLIENITYSFEYSINSDNPTRYNFLAEQPTASWSHINLYDGVTYDTLDNLVNSTENKLACFTEIISSIPQASRIASFRSYIESDTYETKDPQNMVYINFTPDVVDTDATDRRYWVTFSALKVYYDNGELTEENLKALQEMIDYLESLGIAVEISNEKLDDISSKLDGVKDSVEDVKDSVDNVGEDVAENIANKDKEEAGKTDKEVSSITEQFKDFEYSIDFKDIQNVYSSLWTALSSTNTRKSITIEGFAFKGNTLWEETTVDFSEWLSNPYVSLLISFVQILIAIRLIVWVVEFWYVLIQFFVGNWDGSMSDILYKYNPFT